MRNRKIIFILSSALMLTSLASCDNNNDLTLLNESKKDVNEYIDSFDYSPYKIEEQNIIKELFIKLQELIKNSNDVDEIKAMYENVLDTISNLKTISDYEKIEDEKNKNELELAKINKIKSLNYHQYENIYRKEELSKINNEKNKIIDEINKATSLDDLNNINLVTYNNLLNNSKTDSNYLMSEILKYNIDSSWDLVNEHRDQMKLNDDYTITTYDDGYALDTSLYSLDNLNLAFSINTNNYVTFAGILLVNENSSKDGLNGYGIFANRASDHEWYQVWYLENAYGTNNNAKYQYIGGWVYTDSYPNGKVTNNMIKVSINDDTLIIYKLEDYNKYLENAKQCKVDLTFNGLYKTSETYHFGIISWSNGGNSFNFELGYIANKIPISGNEKAKDIFNKEINKLDYSICSKEQIEKINNKKDELNNLDINSEGYYSKAFETLNYINNEITLAITNLKNSINEYIKNFNLTLYRDKEKETINGYFSSLKTFINTSNDYNKINKLFIETKENIDTLKTDEDYKKIEEEIKNNLDLAKKNKINQLVLPSINDYRQEEIDKFNSKIEELTNSINALNDIDEVNNFDISSYTDLVNTSKNNAQHTLDEIINANILAKWSLVNDHKAQMTYDNQNEITTHDDGYALTNQTYSLSNIDMIFSINTNETMGYSGALFANLDEEYSGINGYAILINTEGNNQHLRIYKIINGYGNSGPSDYPYIGGWVFNDSYPNETVNNTKFRIIINNGILKAYKNSDYEIYKEEAKGISVDLTNNGAYQIEDNYHFGLLTWGNSSRSFKFELDKFDCGTILSTNDVYKNYFVYKYNSLDLSLLGTNSLSLINAKKEEIESLTKDDNYVNKIIEATKYIDEIANNEKVNNSILIMDNIFSLDNATSSSWDLVNEHALSWTHNEGTNSVTTPNDNILAGWRLTKDEYSDIKMKINISGVQQANPYNAYISKAFLIGAKSNGNYPKGYAITLYQNGSDGWIQVHYMNGNGNGSNDHEFICGVQFLTNNQDIEIEVKGKEIKIYYEGGNFILTNLATNKTSFTLDNYEGGSIGVFNWDDAQIGSAFTLKEFLGKKIN